MHHGLGHVMDEVIPLKSCGGGQVPTLRLRRSLRNDERRALRGSAKLLLAQQKALAADLERQWPNSFGKSKGSAPRSPVGGTSKGFKT